MSMNNSELIKSLEKRVFLSKGSRIQRLIKSPQRMLFSKFLAITALLSGRSFRIRKKTFWNEDMYIIIPETVSLNLYRYGFNEEGLTKIILKYLKNGMTFFDIGSHFGYYTLLGSSLVGNSGQVHAFEPTPSTFEILKSNTLKKSNVVLNNLAVASARKALIINDYGIRYSAFNSTCNPRLSEKTILKLNPKRYEIQAISIDEYVEENKIKPDFIKIDAESSEYDILLGMKQTIEKFHPIISIEIGDYNIEGIPTSKELIKFLLDKGYQAYEHKDGEILPHTIIEEPYQYDNILFLPKE